MTHNNAIWLLATISNLTLFGCLVLRFRRYREMFIIQAFNLTLIAVQNVFHLDHNYENWAALQAAEIFAEIAMLGYVNASPTMLSAAVSMPCLLSMVISACEDVFATNGSAVEANEAYYAACWLSILSDFAISFCVYHRLIGKPPKGEA